MAGFDHSEGQARGTASNMPAGRYAMSVDVEDYFQVWAFSDVIARKSWDGFEFRVGESTRRCLDLFDEHGTKATFFTLGLSLIHISEPTRPY